MIRDDHCIFVHNILILNKVKDENIVFIHEFWDYFINPWWWESTWLIFLLETKFSTETQSHEEVNLHMQKLSKTKLPRGGGVSEVINT